MRRIPVLAAVAVLASLVPAGASPAPPPPQPRVVVAVIDTAPNPYHEFVHAGGGPYTTAPPSSVTPDVLAEFGIDEAHVIRVTRTGDFAADFDQDRAQFDAIRKGEPYWFEGTNIIAISFNNTDKQRLRPDGTVSQHGVGTYSAVLAANPEAIVVSVEGPGGADRPIEQAWAFGHPAVDLVSTSYGPPFSPPLTSGMTHSYRGVVTNGKLLVGASDNSPALSPIDQTSGPWWSIGVAGYHEGSNGGREPLSGSLPDVVGDFTQTLPYCRRCEAGMSSASGTSFATPRTAGTLSKIILEARRAAGHTGGIDMTAEGGPLLVSTGGFSISGWDVRRAMEEAAYVPRTADYSPGAAVPVNDGAPWAQVGWGAVTPDVAKGVVAEGLAQLGVAGTPTRSKDAATCAFMTANMQARFSYWTDVIGDTPPTPYPYIAC